MTLPLLSAMVMVCPAVYVFMVARKAHCVDVSPKPSAMPLAPSAMTVPPEMNAVPPFSVPMSMAPLPPLVGPLTVTSPPSTRKLPFVSSPSPSAVMVSLPPVITRLGNSSSSPEASSVCSPLRPPRLLPHPPPKPRLFEPPFALMPSSDAVMSMSPPAMVISTASSPS